MSVFYKVDNLVQAREAVIIHGCNCFNVMGSGVARALAEAYPCVPKADNKYGKPGDRSKLGTWSAAILADAKSEPAEWNGTKFLPRTVVNAYTQYDTGTDKRRLDYNALIDALESIVRYFKGYDNVTWFAVPKIGCGLAGGDWDIVESILKVIANRYNTGFVVYVMDEKEIPLNANRISD